MINRVLIICGISMCTCLSSNGQLVQDGTYIGYEKIDAQRFPNGNLHFYPGVARRGNIRTLGDTVYFHQVTVVIKNDSLLISKVPLVLQPQGLSYTDSLGGFYSYVGSLLTRRDSSKVFLVTLTSTKKTGRIEHGVSLYVMYLYQNIRVDESGFTADVGSLKNVLYRKIQ
jgi:hypothetical protein